MGGDMLLAGTDMQPVLKV